MQAKQSIKLRLPRFSGHRDRNHGRGKSEGFGRGGFISDRCPAVGRMNRLERMLKKKACRSFRRERRVSRSRVGSWFNPEFSSFRSVQSRGKFRVRSHRKWIRSARLETLTLTRDTGQTCRGSVQGRSREKQACATTRAPARHHNWQCERVHRAARAEKSSPRYMPAPLCLGLLGPLTRGFRGGFGAWAWWTGHTGTRLKDAKSPRFLTVFV